MALYLDIETNYSGEITVVGMYSKKMGLVQLLRPQINAEELINALPPVGKLYTYNGHCFDLPVISGLSVDSLRRSRKIELEQLKLALDVLHEYARLGLSKSLVPEELHIGEAGRITLTVGKEGMTLELGKGSFRQRLLMAERVVGEARRAGRAPSIVFADNEAHPERVVVRMR